MVVTRIAFEMSWKHLLSSTHGKIQNIFFIGMSLSTLNPL